ncbi:hypothetical protein Gbfr_047_009 [Gluconobacter frateurii M-2]|nr:hypothetical protein Gbfr_047_009 [Gluconobacter frateurii M-2]
MGRELTALKRSLLAWSGVVRGASRTTPLQPGRASHPKNGWYEALRGNPGDHVFGIGGGHLLMIDNARGLADILLQNL